MTLKSEPVINHVWTTNTPDELNTLVAGYLSGGWKLLEAKVTQVDRYNRMLEVLYIFAKSENVYNQDETTKVKNEKTSDEAIIQVGSRQYKSKVEVETVPV